MTHKKFSSIVYGYYREHKRDLPWRALDALQPIDRLYCVTVSELMLQQTQVTRVIDKYNTWMHQWPTLDAFMKSATLPDVLGAWSGLGYNRRALYLFEALKSLYAMSWEAQDISVQTLTQLKGIGINTAAAIAVYAYNEPHTFIETNIRTVYLTHYYKNTNKQVTDKEILSIVAKTVDTSNPREWYWALMDYGAYLKKSQGSQLSMAKSHKKQAKFSGSFRQLRGVTLKHVIHSGPTAIKVLEQKYTDDRLAQAIESLAEDGLIEIHEGACAVRAV